MRSQIDYNTGIMQDFIGELERIQGMKPDYAQDVEEVLAKSKKVDNQDSKNQDKNGGNI